MSWRNKDGGGILIPPPRITCAKVQVFNCNGYKLGLLPQKMNLALLTFPGKIPGIYFFLFGIEI